MAAAGVLGPLVDQRLEILSVEITSEDFATLADYVEGGTVRPVIDRTHPLTATPTRFATSKTATLAERLSSLSRSSGAGANLREAPEHPRSLLPNDLHE